MLLTHEQIQQEYDAMYSDIPSLRQEFLLCPSPLTELQVAEFEKEMNLTLPEVFRRTILTYDFQEFNMGGANFGFMGKSDYLAQLKELNLPEEFNWWDLLEERPPEFLLIAGSDGYNILLNVHNDSIHAYEHAVGCECRQYVATNIDLFLRAAGMADQIKRGREELKGDEEEIAKLVAAEVGAETKVEPDEDFWVVALKWGM